MEACGVGAEKIPPRPKGFPLKSAQSPIAEGDPPLQNLTTVPLKMAAQRLRFAGSMVDRLVYVFRRYIQRANQSSQSLR